MYIRNHSMVLFQAKHNEVSTRRKKLLSILEEKPFSSQKDLAKQLNVPVETIKSDSANLKVHGFNLQHQRQQVIQADIEEAFKKRPRPKKSTIFQNVANKHGIDKRTVYRNIDAKDL